MKGEIYFDEGVIHVVFVLFTLENRRNIILFLLM